MAWRMARSLDVLLGQINKLYPRRSKISDGGIGDAAHATRDSDHNPWYSYGDSGPLVTARDFTHDPGDGLNCHWLADKLVAHRDPRIKYIIWNKRIWSTVNGWSPYGGPNPHTAHLHLSVRAHPVCDDPQVWHLAAGDLPSEKEEDMFRILLCRDNKDPRRGINAVTPIGYWQLPTQAELENFCAKWGLDPNKVQGNDETKWWGPNLGSIDD